MAKPIFVIGIQRSGTTWLANLLGEHPDIAAVRHEDHHGIHESGYFKFIDNRYGDLRVGTNFVEFAETMLASDYIALTGISRNFLYDLWPTTYSEAFRAIMDDYAQRHDATAWLEKSPMHTLYAEHIASVYPDAVFVGIKRDLSMVMASQMEMKRGSKTESRSNRSKFIARHTIRWVHYNRVLDSFAARFPNRIYLTKYEQLRADTHDSVKEICEFMGLPFDSDMLGQSFAPNTSHSGKVDRTKILTDKEKQLMHRTAAMTQLIPHRTLSAFYTAGGKIRGRPELPSWFFKITRSGLLTPEDEQEIASNEPKDVSV